MAILEKDYSNISQRLLDKASQDKIERQIVKLIIKQGNTVLMLKRAKADSFPDLYELPGGGLDNNEDIFSGARRELFEETGLTIDKFISEPEVFDFTTMSGNEKCRGYFFNITINEQYVVLNPSEHAEFGWFSLLELDNLFIFPEVRNLVRKFFVNN